MDLAVINEKYSKSEKNTSSVSELVYGFFYFYMHTFDSEGTFINISSDGFIPKETKTKYPFDIMDPYGQKNPGRSVQKEGWGIYETIKQFREQLKRLQAGQV